jgi:peptide/nickel transport system permease protein
VKYLKDLRFIFSGSVILIIICMAVFATWIAPRDPLEIDTRQSLKPPSSEHIFGTDEYGRDILSRVIFGSRVSLLVAFTSITSAAIVGTSFGVIGGFYSGWIDSIIMRFMDVVLCFPPIILGIMIVGFLGPGIQNLILVISILYVPYFARIAYGSTLSIKSKEYVDASRVIGATDFHLIRRSILPNILAPIIVQISLGSASVVLLESGLSFLGLGVVPPTPSWGLMIGDGRGYMLISPWYVLWPSIALALTILAINTFGDSLRDILDPTIRSQI